LSDEKPPQDPKDGKKKGKFRVVKTGETVMSKPTPETIKQIFMKSSNLEWIPFAKSMKWDPVESRAQYPECTQWIEEKKQILAREQAEHIAELVFDHRSNWHRNVLKTLREYPEANDAILGIIKKRINGIIKTINADDEGAIIAAQSGIPYEEKFAKVKTSELLSLAAAMKVVTESKHRSLLISDWSVKVAEQFTDPKQFEQNAEKLKDTAWTIQVMGAENLTSGDMQNFLSKWYDKPAGTIHQPEELAPKPPPEEN
jgi:hypothetical protein